MMSKALLCILTAMLLAGVLACHNSSIPTPETTNIASLVPRSTIPPGIDPEAIKEPSPEDVATVQALAQKKAYRVMSIKGTYAAQVPGRNKQSYNVDEDTPFVGRFDLWHSYDVDREFVLICMLDHRQISCAPGDPLRHHVTLAPFEHLEIPLKTPTLNRGLHDFSVTYWPDPYLDHDDPSADSRVLGFTTDRDRVSLFVGRDPTPPEIDADRLTGKGPFRELEFLYVHQKEKPFGRHEGVDLLTHLQATPNTRLEFYVHLNNRLEANIDLPVAVTAFVDYRQVPLFRNGIPHTPLYVEVPAQTWQPVKVQLQVPSEPGFYELVVVGTLFPYARMDEYACTDRQGPLQELGVALLRAHTSARILLEVEA